MEPKYSDDQIYMLNAIRETKLKAGHPVHNTGAPRADAKQVAQRHEKAKASRKAARKSKRRR